MKALAGSAVKNITETEITFENIAGEIHTITYDYSMLLPPFSGVEMQAFDRQGNDISSKLFAPSGFMWVDGDYTPRPYEEWSGEEWPKTYQCPAYENIFAAGIAFAPPHQISRPYKSPNGTVIAPAPPRTGMPSGTIGKEVALSIVSMIKKDGKKLREASLADLGAACVASTGSGLTKGSAAAMVMYPVVPDNLLRPDTGGRDPKHTRGEIGLFGHWTKVILHIGFIYKAKAHPFWWLIPE